MDADDIKQLQRQVSKLQLEAKLRKSVANELERQKNLVQKARDEAEEQRAKFERASERLSQYLSPQICEQILGSEEFSGLETNKKNLTIFFSDIVDFTALSERMSPDELKNFLHFYMTEMSNIAIEFGGTIDKYIGDSIMVFLETPTLMVTLRMPRNAFGWLFVCKKLSRTVVCRLKMILIFMSRLESALAYTRGAVVLVILEANTGSNILQSDER